MPAYKYTQNTPTDPEYYRNAINKAVDHYINFELPDPKDIYNRLTFSGMIRYIYLKVFKPSKDVIIYNNRNTVLDYSNIYLLMDIYEMYYMLCAKYKQEYTINNFLSITGIEIDTINNWIKGVKIPTVDGKPKELWINFSKSIKYNSEKALSDSMLNGNLMAYAQLKCWYHWKEEGQPEQITQAITAQSREEIAAKYAAAELPEPPEMPL